jgi:hypothetical protein
MQDEVAYIQEGQYVILEKENPWADDRSIYICAGSTRLLTKKAAEEAITSLDGEWTLPFPSVSQEDATEYIAQIQYIPEDEELPTEALRMEIDPISPEYISAEEASEDVDYLFYLLSHGYSGYGYFMTRADFDEAKKSILREVETTSQWSPHDLSHLLYEHLTFIHDCHFRVGTYTYCSHKDFWYDTTLELSQTEGTYSFTSENVAYHVISINGEDPDEFIFPSLNAQGDPIYRVGMLSPSPPEPLVLTAQHDHEQHQFTVQLHCSDFTYFSDDLFQEDTIGGIPVVRIRSFSDAAAHTEYINQFFETAHTFKGEPCLIIDIRGNIGGNGLWPKTWVTRFTGHQPSDLYYYTELISKTTAMGRVNLMEYLLAMYPDTQIYENEMDRFTAKADAFEKQYTTLGWTGPISPDDRVIPNDTTLLVIINGKTLSAAELFIIYLSQVENVVFVGENSGGCLTFGLANFYRLPHSNLLVELPMSLSVPLDLEFREERGFFPHLWIPAEDALNYAVAALRKGTITTLQPLPEEVIHEEFIPEESVSNTMYELFLPVLSLTILGIIPAVVNRKRNKLFFFIFGIIWAAVGIIVSSLVSPVGYVFCIVGVVYITIGVYKWKKTTSEPISRR